MRALLLAAALSSLAGLALAKPPPIFPEPLIAACDGKPAGAPCKVNFGGTTKSGVCVKLQDESLACMQPRSAGKSKPKPKP